MTTPVYTHDCGCGRCRFLGSTGPTPIYPRANAVDHYVCEGTQTAIQRASCAPAGYYAVSAYLLYDRRGSEMSDRWEATLAFLDAGAREIRLAA